MKTYQITYYFNNKIYQTESMGSTINAAISNFEYSVISDEIIMVIKIK